LDLFFRSMLRAPFAPCCLSLTCFFCKSACGRCESAGGLELVLLPCLATRFGFPWVNVLSCRSFIFFCGQFNWNLLSISLFFYFKFRRSTNNHQQ
jgi:hypothetical protein